MTLLNTKSAPVDALEDEVRSLTHAIAVTERKIQSLEAERDRMRAERISIVAEMQARHNRAQASIEPKVSDHALVRYIERIHGIDLDVIRNEILTPEIVRAMKAGAERVTIGGVRFVVKNGVLVTVIADDPKPPPKPRRKVKGNYTDIDPIIPDEDWEDE